MPESGQRMNKWGIGGTGMATTLDRRRCLMVRSAGWKMCAPPAASGWPPTQTRSAALGNARCGMSSNISPAVRPCWPAVGRASCAAVRDHRSPARIDAPGRETGPSRWVRSTTFLRCLESGPGSWTIAAGRAPDACPRKGGRPGPLSRFRPNQAVLESARPTPIACAVSPPATISAPRHRCRPVISDADR